MEVRWSDGDSFKFQSGPHKGSGVRLQDFNTLESYGPVHRWGKWTAQELYDIARTSKGLGAEGVWNCSAAGEKDGYGRLLVSCPDAARALIAAGHAHAFGVEGTPDPSLMSVQKKAQRQGKGIWKKGVPDRLLTSLHSADEGSGYNRTVDTSAGSSSVRSHDETYEICQEVCEGLKQGGSCMTYVPYKMRYRNKPDCLN